MLSFTLLCFEKITLKKFNVFNFKEERAVRTIEQLQHNLFMTLYIISDESISFSHLKDKN